MNTSEVKYEEIKAGDLIMNRNNEIFIVLTKAQAKPANYWYIFCVCSKDHLRIGFHDHHDTNNIWVANYAIHDWFAHEFWKITP